MSNKLLFFNTPHCLSGSNNDWLLTLNKIELRMRDMKFLLTVLRTTNFSPYRIQRMHACVYENLSKFI